MRVLVSVASRHGGTLDMGAVVAEVLREAGHEVDEVDPDDVEHADHYQAVVLGTAVYVGRMSLSMRDLVERQAGQLSGRPVWLFWSGPVGDTDGGATTPDDVTSVAEAVGARGVRMFPGRLERDELNISERALAAMVHAEQGDFRDLDEVRQWASQIAAELRRPAAR